MMELKILLIVWGIAVTGIVSYCYFQVWRHMRKR